MVIMEAAFLKTAMAITTLLMSNLELWIIKHDMVNHTPEASQGKQRNINGFLLTH